VSPEAQLIVISERSKFGDEGEELCNLVCVHYSLFLFSSYERCDQEDAPALQSPLFLNCPFRPRCCSKCRRSIERIRFASADRLSDICEEALLPEKNCKVQIVYRESAKYLLPERIAITDRLDRMSIRQELLPDRNNWSVFSRAR
jgi:hypothetical protein